jgi:NAD(P)-dependent dehydrogenase (short-subunit alcohol dehydrogenase family)
MHSKVSSDKVILITGSRRGIGAATALLAAEQGYKVCINYHSELESPEGLLRQIGATSNDVIIVKCDVRKDEDVIRLFDTIDKKLGRLTAVVNNAAIQGGRKLLKDMETEEIRKVIETNVIGTFVCTREAVKRMSNNAVGGSIVNVTSQAAVFGGNQLTHYASSKAAINTFTIGLAREIATSGIRVNAVSPGIIDTGHHEKLSAEDRSRIDQGIPMGRMGRPEEVAETIMWLLSTKASYITGAIVPVAGGR